MLSRIKFCIIADEDNKEKIELLQKIKEELINNLKCKNVISYTSIKQNTMSVTKLKPDIFLFISDDIEEFEKYFEKLKNPFNTILITENLHTTFIQESVNISKEIIYAKLKIQEIIYRIQNCMKEINIA